MHRLWIGQTFILATTVLLTTAAMAQPGATLTIDLAQPKAKVSPQLYGLMTEEINYSYDGGLYGELVRNRTFQDRGKIPPSWFLYEEGNADASMVVDRTTGPSSALPLSLQLTVKSASAHDQAGISNLGYWGFPVSAANHLPRIVLCQGQRSIDGPGDRKPGRR